MSSNASNMIMVAAEVSVSPGQPSVEGTRIGGAVIRSPGTVKGFGDNGLGSKSFLLLHVSSSCVELGDVHASMGPGDKGNPSDRSQRHSRQTNARKIEPDITR